MLVPDNLTNQLGFDTILDQLLMQCSSELGQQHIKNISWQTDSAILRELFDDLAFFLTRTESGGHEFLEMEGISGMLKKLNQHGEILELEELLILANTLRNTISWRDILGEKATNGLNSDNLNWDAIEILSQALSQTISEEGEIKDTASPELKKIRKALVSQESRVRKIAYKVYGEFAAKGWVPEGSSIAIRNGRYVVPVKSENKRSVAGYVQDESSAGTITFIEPREVVDTSNELMSLRQEERREIYRILSEITVSINQIHEEIALAVAWLGYIDFLNAKAKFSHLWDMNIPEFGEKITSCKLIDCYHLSLLNSNKSEKKETIPLNIILSPESRLVVISGPNAGGKSVALKTVGLSQLMFQHGLPIKASDGSTMLVFEKMFVDIGDNQSIENDLSTYSSHLLMMKRCIEEATENSLVLFDEFGSGTEPRIGGAIAEVALKHINQKKAYGVITTHYINIKEFAEREEGIINANMQFDVDKMLPQFKLDIGRPGSSFAVEIARKTGFPEKILQEASELSGVDLMDLEVMLAKVQQQSKELDEKQTEIDSMRDKLQGERDQYVRLKHDLDERKKEILKRAAKEAEWLLEGANKEIEKTIRHIKTTKAHKEETKKVRGKLDKKKEDLKKRSTDKDKLNTQILALNDRVRISGQESTGIIQKVGKKDAEVLVGSLTLRIALSKLELVEKDKIQTKQQTIVRRKGIDLTSRRAQFSTELNIRGMRGDEALVNLDKFLDDAILMGSSELRILHGKGDGILRKLVQQSLRKHPAVARYDEEHPDFGGSGVTLVQLK